VGFSNWPEGLPRPGNHKLQRLPSLSPWFEIYRVNEDTVALIEPHHYEEAISYLLVGDERAVLFDTGMGIADMRAEVECLTDLPIVVVNSHSHYDHIGDNHRFAEVWAFDDDGEIAYTERGLSRKECAKRLRPGTYRQLPPGFDPATYEIRPSRITRRLLHGQIIELGGRALTVHHTPGHSPGSICLLDGHDGLLFTGDTFYPGMLYAHFEDSDVSAYEDSIRYLVARLGEVSHLCPAHNEAHVEKEMLIRVQNAFDEIAADRAPHELQGDIRVYRFDGFGLTVPAAERRLDEPKL
jgi:glyoxylase-like metal-dependent hydrolase (beta-lactamase superfamily II)